MSYQTTHPLILKRINGTAPLKGYTGTRQDINLDRLAELCKAIRVDVAEVLAAALTPEMTEEIGADKQAKLALEILKLAEGKKVTVDGSVDHKHTHESVSETDQWIADMLGDDTDRPPAKAGTH